MVTLVWAFSFGMILPPLIEVVIISSRNYIIFHFHILGLGHPGPGQRNIFVHNPEERRKVSEEVSLHLRLSPPLHRHHPLLLRHLLQGATEQVKNYIEQQVQSCDIKLEHLTFMLKVGCSLFRLEMLMYG